MPGTDLLAQLRQFLAIEQAARAVAPADAMFTGGPFVGDGGTPSAPNAGPAQADAMILDLLSGARDDELQAALAAAGPKDGSQEAMWLADEIERRATGG